MAANPLFSMFSATPLPAAFDGQLLPRGAATAPGAATSTGSTAESLRTKLPPALSQSLFNTPVYQQNRINPQQHLEMQQRSDDQFRRDTNRTANNLDRSATQAENQLSLRELGNASSAALGAYNTLSSADRQDETMRLGQLGSGIRTLSPLLANLFSGMG